MTPEIGIKHLDDGPSDLQLDGFVIRTPDKSGIYPINSGGTVEIDMNPVVKNGKLNIHKVVAVRFNLPRAGGVGIKNISKKRRLVYLNKNGEGSSYIDSNNELVVTLINR